MGLTYTQATDLSLLDPVELSERLASTLRDAVPWLVTLSNADASIPEREGKWSTKEVIGHLTDSAVNNLGRIVRMQIAHEHMPGYAQEQWSASSTAATASGQKSSPSGSRSTSTSSGPFATSTLAPSPTKPP